MQCLYFFIIPLLCSQCYLLLQVRQYLLCGCPVRFLPQLPQERIGEVNGGPYAVQLGTVELFPNYIVQMDFQRNRAVIGTVYLCVVFCRVNLFCKLPVNKKVIQPPAIVN